MVTLEKDPLNPLNKFLVLRAEKINPDTIPNSHDTTKMRVVKFHAGALQTTYEWSGQGRKYGFEPYGIFEARIQLPATSQAKGTFWLFGGSESIEIDIIEEARGKDYAINNALNWPEPSSGHPNVSNVVYSDPPLTDDFHIFSIVWTPENLTFYLDGIQTHSLTDNDITIKMSQNHKTEMRFNLAPATEEGVDPDDYDMKIDWIKVWKYSPETCCPYGTTWDKANCKYESVEIPSGYKPFIWRNNLYTEIGPNGSCPDNTVYDGANCSYQINIPSEYRGFIWPQSSNSTQHFYAAPNCQANPELCCLAGSNWDGANCKFDKIVPTGFEPFIGNDNGLYVMPNKNGLCPDGSNPDPTLEGCYMGTTIPAGIEGFIFNNKFFTKENCNVDKCCPEITEWNGISCIIELPWNDNEVFIENNQIVLDYTGLKCPEGTSAQGNRCLTGINIPVGFEGIVDNGAVLIEPNCESCCPDGFTFDGKDCIKRDNYNILQNDGDPAVKPNCFKYNEENDCCPEGFFRSSPFVCKLKESSDELTIEHNGSEIKLTKDSQSCLDPDIKIRSNQSQSYKKIKNNNVTLYPNPSSHDIFINSDSELNDLQQLIIYNFTGQIIYASQEKKLLINLSKIPIKLESGTYFIFMKFNDQSFMKKIIKL